jgi:DNA-binding MarR family transcriptional regulator
MSRATAPAEIPDARLIEFAELLFFAYRDFTGVADAILADYGFGRAHHRVLHFVCRRPGLRVADLLGILNITKQSLSRVLRQLVARGFIHQTPGDTDKRERLLRATDKGEALMRELMLAQGRLLRDALAAAGPEGEAVVARFLGAMLSENRSASEPAAREEGEHRNGCGEGPELAFASGAC